MQECRESAACETANSSFPIRCLAEGLGAFVLLFAVIVANVLPRRAALPETLSTSLPLFAYAIVLSALLASVPRGNRLYLNPAVCLARVAQRDLPMPLGLAYASCEIAGAYAGVISAQWSLNLDAIQNGAFEALSLLAVMAEAAAAIAMTAGVSVAFRTGRVWLPVTIAAGGSLAIGFLLPSVTFANPAVELALTLTSNELGLSPGEAAALVCADFSGASIAAAILQRLRHCHRIPDCS